MSTALQGRIAIRARQVKPGEAYAVEVKAGQLIQITDVAGKQVADFVAFNAGNRAEHLSVSTTRTVGGSIMLQQGMQLVSNRRTPMFELIEDTVGRHDMLLALCDRPEPEPAPIPEPEPVSEGEEGSEPETVGSAAAEAPPTDGAIDGEGASDTTAKPEGSDEPVPEASNGGVEDAPAPEPAIAAAVGCLTAISQAVGAYGIEADQIPDPINWFMNVGIKGRGELEVREPLSERNDYVVLSVLMDAVIAVTACSQTDDVTNGEMPTDILVRVYR